MRNQIKITQTRQEHIETVFWCRDNIKGGFYVGIYNQMELERWHTFMRALDDLSWQPCDGQRCYEFDSEEDALMFRLRYC